MRFVLFSCFDCSHPVINPGFVLIISFLIVRSVFQCYIKSDSIVMAGWRFDSISKEVIVLEPFDVVFSCGMLNHGIGKLIGLNKWTGWWWDVSHIDVHHIWVHVHVNVHCELSGIMGGLTVSVWLKVGVLGCWVYEPLRWHEVVSVQRWLLCNVWLWGWGFGLVGDVLQEAVKCDLLLLRFWVLLVNRLRLVEFDLVEVEVKFLWLFWLVHMLFFTMVEHQQVDIILYRLLYCFFEDILLGEW